MWHLIVQNDAVVFCNNVDSCAIELWLHGNSYLDALMIKEHFKGLAEADS